MLYIIYCTTIFEFKHTTLKIFYQSECEGIMKLSKIFCEQITIDQELENSKI